MRQDWTGTFQELGYKPRALQLENAANTHKCSATLEEGNLNSESKKRTEKVQEGGKSQS